MTTQFRPTRILVPTDFSQSAGACVEAAAALAHEFRATVFLLNIIPMFPIVPVPGHSNDLFPAQEYLADARSYAHNIEGRR